MPRKIVLVLLFLLRMSERVTVMESISQIGRMSLRQKIASTVSGARQDAKREEAPSVRDDRGAGHGRDVESKTKDEVAPLSLSPMRVRPSGQMGHRTVIVLTGHQAVIVFTGHRAIIVPCRPKHGPLVMPCRAARRARCVGPGTAHVRAMPARPIYGLCRTVLSTVPGRRALGRLDKARPKSQL
uniref:B1292H11.2 protein n=1 Tax=Oryza sativa subsp. japonica TaxID=39947 RepID=Q6MWC9_ORYSJ|nr:B1292H11.2 [Oryza sativa Japonica Group]